jgi:dynein heavy chain
MIVKNMLYIGSTQPPSGGKNPIDPRFLSLFSIFNFTFPTEESIFKIYTSILTKHLEQ